MPETFEIVISPTVAPIDTQALDSNRPAISLDASDLAYLTDRGLHPAVIQGRGYFSTDATDLADDDTLGWTWSQKRAMVTDEGRPVRTMALPMYSGRDEDGAVVAPGELVPTTIQIRMHTPRMVEHEKATEKATAAAQAKADKVAKAAGLGEAPKVEKVVVKRPLKFEVPAWETAYDAELGTNRGGAKAARGYLDGQLPVDVHPFVAQYLDDVSVPVIISEGIPKCDSILSDALSSGICIVPLALTGVTLGYESTPADLIAKGAAPRRLVPGTLGIIPWAGRECFIAFDGDVLTNSMVKTSLHRMAELLTAAGAIVRMVTLPTDASSPAGMGIDDWLAAENKAGRPMPLQRLLNGHSLNAAEAAAVTAYFSPDDVGRGERLAMTNVAKGDLLYCVDEKPDVAWRQYDPQTGIWNRARNRAAMFRATELTAQDVNNQEVYKQARQARSISAAVNMAAIQPSMETRANEFDIDPNIIVALNGQIDLLDGSLLPHNPRAKATKNIPVNYDPKATCPTWDAFLMTTFGSDLELIAYVRRAFGMALFGEVRIWEGLHLAVGGGRNGKSVLEAQISAIFGEAYTRAINPNMLLGLDSDEEKSELLGARLVIAQEPELGSTLNDGSLKGLVSKDKINARGMYATRINFLPSHSTFVFGNHYLNVRDTGLATWRRLRAIPFLHTVAEKDVDVDLGAKLSLERQGILNFLVAGALEAKRDGLGMCDAVEKATAAWRGNNDVFGSFLNEVCVVDPKARANKKFLYEEYQQWAIAQGMKFPWQRKAFYEALMERGIIDRSNPFMKSGDHEYVRGLTLKSEVKRAAKAAEDKAKAAVAAD